jgi:peptidyl-prolyl cis-trans isomerase D
MLESLRRNAKSTFVYLIFGVLIIVFVLQFGPQSGQFTGCGGAVRTAARVGGSDIDEGTWRYGILLRSGGSASGERARRAQVREQVLDALIVREVLAQTAEDMGFKISDAEVRERVVKGDIVLLNQKEDGKRFYWVREDADDEPRFMAQALENFARGSLGLGSLDKFLEQEKRELLAQKVRDLIAASVRVSPEEVQQEFQLNASKVEIEYVGFPSATYRQKLEPSAADVDAYLAAHEAELKAQYEKEADRWKGRDKEVRVRHILVKSERPATPPSTGTGAAPPDPARAKAEAALARIKSGEDFAAVARSVSPDAARGGDLGWRPLRALRMGQEVADEVAKLQKGQTTGVIATMDGYFIVQLVDAREGDLAFDAVKHDLAETALLDERARAAAKADAEKALAAAKAGTPLDKQFPADGAETPSAPGAKPRLQKGTDIGRIGGYVAGIGTSKELVTALFDKLQVGELAPEVFEVSGDYFVVRLTARDEPDMKKFQEEKARLTAQMQQYKAFSAVMAYQAQRCNEARERGEIDFDPSFVQYPEAEDAVPTSYVPCQTLR